MVLVIYFFFITLPIIYDRNTSKDLRENLENILHVRLQKGKGRELEDDFGFECGICLSSMPCLEISCPNNECAFAFHSDCMVCNEIIYFLYSFHTPAAILLIGRNQATEIWTNHWAVSLLQ
jgi:hypothetical protein